MRKLIISVVFALAEMFAVAQAVQRGIVQEYNEGAPKTALPGVEVRVYPAQSTVSDAQGKFELEFLTLNPGERINVRRIEKEGYEIFNKDALEQWNLSPDNVFSIVMCRSDRFKQLKDTYYANSSERYSRQYRNATAELRRLRDSNRLQQQEFADSLRVIEDLYARQLENLDNYVDRFARIDLSEISAAEQEIIALVREGKIDEAIARYDRFNASSQLIDAIQQRNRVKNTITQLLEVNSSLKYSIDSLYAMVDRQIQALQLAGDYRNNAKIQNLYTTIADIDTTNVKWLLKASEFLWKMRANSPLAEHYAQLALNTLLREDVPDQLLLGWCYHQFGLNYINKCDYAKAEQYFNKDLELMENYFGFDDSNLAILYHNLSLVYCSQAYYTKAEEFCKKALEIQLYGAWPEETYVVNPHDKIDSIDYSQSDYAKAEEFYNKTLEIPLCLLNSQNPDVALTCNNLGMVYYYQGNYTKAEEFFNKALEIQLRVLDSENLNIALTYNNLGLFYDSQSDYVRAEEFHKRALEIRLHMWGPEHPDVADSYFNLGRVYYYQGDYTKAEEFYNKALEIRFQALGPDHPDVAGSYNNLGAVYFYQGDYAKAEEFYNKALEIRLRVLRADHPDVAEPYTNLGLIYYSQSNYARAEEFYNKALAILLQSPGSRHSYIASIYDTLGKIYTTLGNYDKAIDCFTNELDYYSVESDNTATINACRDLSTVYYSSGQYSEARHYLARTISLLEHTEETVGDELKVEVYSLYLKTLIACMENDDSVAAELVSFMSDKLWGVSIPEDTSTGEDGISGKYYVLEYGDCDFTRGVDLLSTKEALQGQPKSLVLMQDGSIGRYDFENQVGMVLQIRKVTPEEKTRVTESYRQWKNNNE